MLKRITRRLLVPAILTGMLSGLVPSMLAVRTAHADETSQPESSTSLDRTATPAPKQTDASEPAPLTADDVQVRSAVVPSDALASGTAGSCLFYITSDMRLVLTPADGQSGTLPVGSKASDWPWYRYAAYIRSVSFDRGVRTSTTLENAFSSASTTDPEYSQLESVDLANLDMAALKSMRTAFGNDVKLRTVSFKGVLDADGITTWAGAFYSSGVESVDLTGVGDAATTVHGMFQNCAGLKTAVIPWTMAHVTDAAVMFAYDTSLTTLDTSAWRFGAVWDMSDMFNGCKGLGSLNSSGWDMSAATNMGHMFYGCSNLAALDSAGWHVAKAKYVDHMFDGCSRLKALDVSGWDVSNVRLAGYMFYNCKGLTALDVSGWRLPNATETEFMFNGCSGLTALDVSGFDLGADESMNAMFAGCSGLTALDVSAWRTGDVADFTNVFSGCTNLGTLDVSKWDTGKATRFNGTFTSCSKLAELDVSAWRTGDVADFTNMFYNCKGLTALDVSKWDTGKATRFDDMFYGCPNLKALDVSAWDVSKAVIMRYMFHGCSSLKVLDVSAWHTSACTDLDSMFADCSGLTTLDVSGWDVSHVADMHGAFYGCSALRTLPVADWDVSAATDIGQMFDSCASLGTLDVSRWNVGRVRDIDWLFSHCRNLKTIDVSKWTPHGLSRLYGVFSDCRSVRTLDLSAWDTTGVTSVHNLFHQCASLTRIYVGGGWDMDQVTEDDLLFDGDTLLVGDDGKGLAYDASKNGKAYARPNGGYLTLKAGAAMHVVVFRTPDGATVSSMRVRDGQTATAPALAATTWLADPDMNFNTDRWSGAFTAKGKRQGGRDDYAGSVTTKWVSGGATVRVDVDADYTDAKAGGSIGWQYIVSNSSAWNGLWCAAGAKCSSSIYSTFASDGTVRPFTQINTWSDFGEAYIRHMQLTQVDPVTHNGIARDGYVFTGWDRDTSKPITDDTVFTARYRPVSYAIRFDGNKATSGTMADQTFTYGTAQPLTAATFQRDGYSLTGWNTRPDGTGKAFTDKQTVANLLTHDGAVGTLYAQWTPTPPVITVVFHRNDTGTDETVKRVWASNNLDMKAIGPPDGWERKGYALHGWNTKTDGSGVEYQAGESLYGRMTTATVDLYAQWAGLRTAMPLTGSHRRAATVMGAAVIVAALALAVAARRRAATHALGA